MLLSVIAPRDPDNDKVIDGIIREKFLLLAGARDGTQCGWPSFGVDDGCCLHGWSATSNLVKRKSLISDYNLTKC